MICFNFMPACRSVRGLTSKVLKYEGEYDAIGNFLSRGKLTIKFTAYISAEQQSMGFALVILRLVCEVRSKICRQAIHRKEVRRELICLLEKWGVPLFRSSDGDDGDKNVNLNGTVLPLSMRKETLIARIVSIVRHLGFRTLCKYAAWSASKLIRTTMFHNRPSSLSLYLKKRTIIYRCLQLWTLKSNKFYTATVRSHLRR